MTMDRTKNMPRLTLTVLADASVDMKPLDTAKAFAVLLPEAIREGVQTRWGGAAFRARLTAVPPEAEAKDNEWFDLADDEGFAAYRICADSLCAGGASDAELMLDALETAMMQMADEPADDVKERRIILLMTNGYAGDADQPSIADRVGQLAVKWSAMNDTGKRLVLLAPDEAPWRTIGQWEHTAWHIMPENMPLTEEELRATAAMLTGIRAGD